MPYTKHLEPIWHPFALWQIQFWFSFVAAFKRYHLTEQNDARYPGGLILLGFHKAYQSWFPAGTRRFQHRI